MSRRQKYTSLFLLVAVLVGVFLIPDVTSAQIEKESIMGGILIFVTKLFLWIASLAMQLAIFFLKFFILLAGYNGYINADVVKFGWNIIRDVANMFFIVILLVIAFGTILGLEQYEWKKSLPKLVFAAVFVNFSNVICQLIIDVSQVFTLTFLNAVAGTAGGNLINLMKFDQVFSIIKSAPTAPGAEIEGDLLIGALMAVFLTVIAATTIGSYMIVLLYRVVTLWCLIILSPLAFLFSVLPSTQSYADEFWKEFINHVIAAPVMVFFLWLAFATMGGNDVVSTNLQEFNMLEGYELDSGSNAVAEQTSVSISEATSWINLGNFAVAIGFLLIGIERVQKLGVRGGDYLQRGLDFGKKVFTIAAGYTLGRAIVDRGKTGGIAVGKGLAEATYIPHMARMGAEKAKRGWYKTLGAAELRRQGSLAVSHHATEAVKERLIAEGHRKSSAHHTEAEENVKLATEKRRGESEGKELEAKIKIDMIDKEEKIYEARKKKALDALGSRPPSDKELAAIQLKAKEGLSTLEAMAAEGLANRQVGKTTKRDNSVLSEIRDAQRVSLDNKKRKYRKDFEEKDWREDMEDFAHSDFDERFEEIQTEYEKAQKIRTKIGAKSIKDARKDGDISEDEEKQLKAATKNLIQLTSSAFENDQANFLWNKLGSLDASWAGKPVTSDNEHEALLSLWSGKTVGAGGTTSSQEQEKELRAMYGKDWNLLGRNMMRSMNAAANRTGNNQDEAQILKGKDEYGLDAFGFANNMSAGNLGSATGQLSTGDARTGAVKRMGKEVFSRSSRNLGSYKDAMSLIEFRPSDLKAMKVRADSESQRVVDSIIAATANELRSASVSLWNMLSGGSVDKGGTYALSSNDITFDPAQADLKNTVNRIINEKRKKYEEANRTRPGAPETDKLKEDALTFMRLLTKDATFDVDRLVGNATTPRFEIK